MSQGQIQEQKQEQRLQQTVSQQQLLQSHLIELPIQQFAERIETEMHDNPALESVADDPDYSENPDFSDSPNTTDDFDSQREQEERSEALDAALESIGRDDEELPVYHGGQSVADDREEIIFGQSQSFYDELLEQVGEELHAGRVSYASATKSIMLDTYCLTMTVSCEPRSRVLPMNWLSIII